MRCVAGLAFALVVLPVGAQDARLETEKVAGNVHMLVGRGGNIGLSVGEDGAFLVDDQFAPMVGQIRAAVERLTDKEVRFVVNTHWHGDHTGGNERFGVAGAVIVAHENVRKRMSVEQFSSFFNRTTAASPAKALPVITFTRDVTFHWNGDEVKIFYVGPAHTDGDVVVHFVGADVVHMGDTFFKGRYPYLDLDSGGSVAGVLAAIDRVLEIVGEETKIIPGHGALAGRADLVQYREVISAVHERVRELVDEGKSLEECIAAKPGAEWDETWGSGFINPETFVRLVYASVTAEVR